VWRHVGGVGGEEPVWRHVGGVRGEDPVWRHKAPAGAGALCHWWAYSRLPSPGGARDAGFVTLHRARPHRPAARERS
jgi:hypothetical protein